MVFQIPAEILENVLAFTNGKDILSNRLVCSQWRKVINSRHKFLPLYMFAEKICLSNGILRFMNTVDDLYRKRPRGLPGQQPEKNCLNAADFPKHYMIKHFEVQFDKANNVIETMELMKSLSGGPVVVENLILYLEYAAIQKVMESRPMLISELFDPKNVYIYPWHFPYFILHPEYIRIPTAASISIHDGNYGIDEPNDLGFFVCNFLYDKNGYANKKSIGIFSSGKIDILEKLVEMFDHMEFPENFFAEVNVHNLSAVDNPNSLLRTKFVLTSHRITRPFITLRVDHRPTIYERTRKQDKWKLILEFSNGHFHPQLIIKMRKDE